MEHFHAQLDSVRLHVAAEGDGRPVVLLHGFPEFWYSWRHQLPALAAAGFRALAPDLRGYNESERPIGVAPYRLQLLVGDIEQLIERHAGGRAVVVGHDWGGVIAWSLAARRPHLVQKLVVLNAPHPAAFRRVLLTNPLQWLRSWYVGFFQLPWLPERAIAARDFWLLERTLKHQPVNHQAFSQADIDRYKDAFRPSGAMTAALNYYRAAIRYGDDLQKRTGRITAPTLVIWGDRDPYLSCQLTRNLERWVSDVRVEHLPNASHWVQNDAPEVVNRLMLEFLAEQT
jgi:pimeloyl-ACP methyl ester carboxylesterase